ncbi:hypothetical protein GF361_04965 [Candidatus Woesearchaeota archaeon]|nr:hypothetical protein [Candidatus Woesearchaeota archaeon]
MNIKSVNKEIGTMYEKREGNTVAFDVSSYADYPFNSLSPFHYSKDFEIPVPGMKGKYSNSVEGIWQGLKIIEGETDERLFNKKPKKRKGIVQGHKFGDDILGLVEARWNIFLPSYNFYLDEYASEDALSAILKKQREGKTIYLYDVEDNDDIRDPRPYAHSAALSTYLNLKVFNKKLKPMNEAEERLFGILDSDKRLDEKIDMIEPLLFEEEIFNAFKLRCVEHPPGLDDYRIAKYFGYGAGKDD